MVVQSTAWISQILQEEKSQITWTIAPGRVWPLKSVLVHSFSEKAPNLPLEKDFFSRWNSFPSPAWLAHRSAADNPFPPPVHLHSYCLFIRQPPHVLSLFLFAMIRKLRLSQQWQKTVPSHARHSRKLTCRNSTFNHRSYTKNIQKKQRLYIYNVDVIYKDNFGHITIAISLVMADLHCCSSPLL